MSHVIMSRYRDNSWQWFSHRIAAEVCRIVLLAPALPAALLAALLLSVAVGRAQTPITYDTVARDTLGETLWTIDLSGPMTPSLDGTKFLVVNNKDNMFYVVDVATGAYRKITSIPQTTSTVPSYNVDAELRWLLCSRKYRPAPDNPISTNQLSIIDIDADTVVFHVDSGGHPLSRTSSKYRRGVDIDRLFEIPSYREIARFPDVQNSRWWFDDAHGVLYQSGPMSVVEYDAVTGAQLRAFGPYFGVKSTVARRAPGSPWLYVVTTEVDDDQVPYVIAYHVETGEKRFFNAFAGSKQVDLRYTSSVTGYNVGLSDGKLVLGIGTVTKPIRTWIIDADAAHSYAHVDVAFRWRGEVTRRPYFVPRDVKLFVHGEPTEDGRNEVTRLRRLVPRASVSASGDEGVVIPSWFRQWPDRIAVVVPVGTADEVVVVSVGGAEVLRLGRERLQATPVDITTTSLASGAYVCRLRMGEQWLSQTFVVTR